MRKFASAMGWQALKSTVVVGLAIFMQNLPLRPTEMQQRSTLDLNPDPHQTAPAFHLPKPYIQNIQGSSLQTHQFRVYGLFRGSFE